MGQNSDQNTTQAQLQDQNQPCKKTPLERLEEKERDLAEKLKTVQLELKTKKQRQAARETNRARKERGHRLILLGLLYETAATKEILQEDLENLHSSIKRMENIEKPDKATLKTLQDRKQTAKILEEMIAKNK